MSSWEDINLKEHRARRLPNGSPGAEWLDFGVHLHSGAWFSDRASQHGAFIRCILWV
jgi:hypothetical protein